MRIRWLVSLLLLLLLPPASGRGEALPATASWQPPDLSGVTAESPEGLLLLAVAQEEVGYQAGPDYKNKYSRWFGAGYSPWCTEFMAWCAHQADARWGTHLLGTVYPRLDTATACARFFVDQNRYIGADGRSIDGEAQWLIGASDYLGEHGYIPQPGDLMLLYVYGRRDRPDHTTLVEGVSRDGEGRVWVHVIEGNMEDSVRRHAYALEDAQIVAFGTPRQRAHVCLDEDSRYGGVNDVRRALLALGYDASGERTYRLGKKTAAALKLFQQDHGLPQSGQVTIETRAALEEALKEKTP